VLAFLKSEALCPADFTTREDGVVRLSSSRDCDSRLGTVADALTSVTTSVMKKTIEHVGNPQSGEARIQVAAPSI
jgi:hypothetical protein